MLCSLEFYDNGGSMWCCVTKQLLISFLLVEIYCEQLLYIVRNVWPVLPYNSFSFVIFPSGDRWGHCHHRANPSISGTTPSSSGTSSALVALNPQPVGRKKDVDGSKQIVLGPLLKKISMKHDCVIANNNNVLLYLWFLFVCYLFFTLIAHYLKFWFNILSFGTMFGAK